MVRFVYCTTKSKINMIKNIKQKIRHCRIFYYHDLNAAAHSNEPPGAAALIKKLNTAPILNNNTKPTSIPTPFSLNLSSLTSPGFEINSHAHCAIKNPAPMNANVRNVFNRPPNCVIRLHRPLFAAIAGATDAIIAISAKFILFVIFFIKIPLFFSTILP